jgi:hypothetical protein
MDPADLKAAWRAVQAAHAGVDEHGRYAVVPDEDEQTMSANADQFARGLPPVSHAVKRQYADGSFSREHAEADLARLEQAQARYEQIKRENVDR